jgi:hypothetical protein
MAHLKIMAGLNSPSSSDNLTQITYTLEGQVKCQCQVEYDLEHFDLCNEPLCVCDILAALLLFSFFYFQICLQLTQSLGAFEAN